MSRSFLRLRVASRPAAPKPGTWSQLAKPVYPSDTAQIQRAQSLLTPTPKGGACPPLTVDQARDVLRWAGELPPAPTTTGEPQQ